MEYTVGSVADLVSGKNTPNKPKVFKRKLPQPIVHTNASSNQVSQHIEHGLVKVKKTEKYAGKPSFHKDNKVPFKKGNRAPFKKERKPLFNKKTQKDHNQATNETDSFTVIDHKLIEDMKAEGFKNEADSDAEADHNSEGEDDSAQIDHKLIEDMKKEGFKNEADSDAEADHNSEGEDDSAQSDTSEDFDNKEVPHWQNPAVKKELDSRTIFVGNIGITVTKTQLLKFFKKYGKVEAVRLRCATPSDPGVSKRVAIIKKMFHPKRATMHSYIRFEKREDALKAVEINGTKYKDHHLRVQISDDLEKPDTSKAIFVGNLPFDVEDDDLWSAFETFGTIKSVRVIRNAGTGMGIGIGYVNFDSSDSVEFALPVDDLTIKGKVVRIQRCKEKGKKPRKERRQERRKHTDNSDGKRRPRPKHKGTKGPWNKMEKNKLKNKSQEGLSKNTDGQEKPKGFKNTFKDIKLSSITVKNSVFQGSKSNKKKQKPKVNRGFIQKLKLSQKVAPRTNISPFS